MDRRAVLFQLAALSSCRARREDQLVFLHQPLWGDAAPFHALLAELPFRLITRIAPSASDALHQYLLTTLAGGSTLDVFVVDTIWVAELVRAGFLAELPIDPEELRRELVAGAAASAIVDGRVFTLPWWIDVGVLYTRRDRADPPRTFDELARLGRYVFQGRQYEGLVCNAYEVIWGFGGGEGLRIDTPEAREALSLLGSLVRTGASPRSVLSAGEEECRRAFQDGRALTMRNWPYAWAELERSSLAGKVAMSPLPTHDGSPGHGCLGGWHLAMSRRIAPEKRAHALALMRHLTSERAQDRMARAFGRPPPRRALYADGQPMAMLAPMMEGARPRPLSPWYPRVSDVLQGELSAIVSGVRDAATALRRAQTQIDRLVAA